MGADVHPSTVEALRAEVQQLRARTEKLERLLRERAAEADAALEHLAAIIDHISDAILVTDARGELRLVNPAVADGFGVGPEVVGRTPEACLPADLASLIRGCLDAEAVVAGEVQLERDRVGKAVVNVIRSDRGAVVGAVALVRDTTIEREVARAKSTFIANVSHELRTPLTSILGFTKVVEKRFATLLPVIPVTDPRTARHVAQVTANLTIVVAESERLMGLINEVLDLATIEAGKMTWTPSEVSLGEIVEQAASVMAPRFADNGVALHLELAPDLPPVHVDRGRMLQVVQNLLSNAAKFTPSGSVRCETRRVGDTVVLAVRDTGIGIPERHLTDVFETFRQIGNPLTDKPVGTGLGLPFSRKVVEYFRGQLLVESQVGVGSTFTVVLPMAAP